MTDQRREEATMPHKGKGKGYKGKGGKKGK